MALDAVVVVPARDEEPWIGGCLEALAAQTVRSFEVIVVLDGCRDGTGAAARRAAEGAGLELTLLEAGGRGAGEARRRGMDAACARLVEADRPRGLIACTDADSRPAPDWLERQLHHVAAGAGAVAGLIELDEDEAAAPSLGVTAEVYRRVGGLEVGVAQADPAFALQLAVHRVPVVRAADVRVRTSARAAGRAGNGLAVDIAVACWFASRRYRAEEFSLADLRARKGQRTVTVIVPTKECAETIGGVLDETVQPLVRDGLVDEVVVVDAGSQDGTAAIAAAAGARVVQQDEIAGEFGPALGKGDAMWRALQASGGDVVCFVDGDTGDPSPRHLQGLLGPLLIDSSVSLVKGAFDRPLKAGEITLPHEGGRVTELMARPLLNLHEPMLAGFSQPLAGEFAARRALLEAISFPVGYGVEIAVLIDALRHCGLDALAECHLGTRQNRHQPLRALGEMAYAVLAAVQHRSGGQAVGEDVAPGRYLRPWESGAMAAVAVQERPPIRQRGGDARPRMPAPAS